jgi:hypothetical protein
MSQCKTHRAVNTPDTGTASPEVRAVILALSLTVAKAIQPLNFADKNRVLLAFHMDIADTLEALTSEA